MESRDGIVEFAREEFNPLGVLVVGHRHKITGKSQERYQWRYSKQLVWNFIPPLDLGDELQERRSLEEGGSPEVVHSERHDVVLEQAPHAYVGMPPISVLARNARKRRPTHL